MKIQHIKSSIVPAIIVCALQACTGARYTSGTVSSVSQGPGGTVTPATGSASNIASGRNTTGTPVTSADPGTIPVAAGITAGGETTNPGNPGPAQDDTPFITEAALSGIAEVSLSELAAEKSQDPDVKAFAVMIVQEHKEANAALKSLAESKNITLPNLNIQGTATGKADSAGQNNGSKRIETAADAAPGTVMEINQNVKKLRSATGKQFDQQYIAMMVQDHQKAINLFEQGTKSADPGIKAYAVKYLPVLKMHLQSVNALSAK
jgi:putative membrane protein